MRVAVSGALGRMGGLITKHVSEADDMELVAAFALSKGEVEGVAVSHADEMESILGETKPDVLIDFTEASGAVENVKKAVNRGVNLVIGTTGFSADQMKDMEDTIDKKVAAVISPNFSIGVNIFWLLIQEAAEYLSDFDVEIIEAHHRYKKDAPSGTAVRAIKLLEKLVAGEITAHSIRAGDIVGDHTVLYAGNGERLEITHSAHSRQASASGAMKATRWVVNAKPGIYGMNDVLGI